MKTLRMAGWMVTVLCVAAGMLAAAEDEGTVISRPAVRLRAGPGPAFPVTDVVREGTLVKTDATSDDGRWKAVTSLSAMEDGKLTVIKAFPADAAAWIALRDLAAPAGQKEPPKVADMAQVKVAAASVAACVRGFDDGVVQYLAAHEIDRNLLDQVLIPPFNAQQFGRFALAHLNDGRFRAVECPIEPPEDYMDAVTMDRLAAMVAPQIAKSLGGVLSNNEVQRRYVALVGTLLGVASPRYELTYRFVLIEHETPNTFCVPGGIVIITTGALKLCQDESELAALLAHEIGHIVLQHAERSPENNAKVVGIDAAGLWTQLEEETTGGSDAAKAAAKELNNMAEWFLTVTLLRPRRVQEELEADQMALFLLARCQYDPQAIQRVLGRLAKANMALPFEDRELRNHPTPRERLEALQKALKRWGRYEGARYETEYRAVVGEAGKQPPAP